MNKTEHPENFNLEYEKKFLFDFLQSIIFLKGDLGRKLMLTGELTEKIATALNCLDDDLFFAGYYADIGMLMLENIVKKPEIISSCEKDIIKEHVYYSSDFLSKRGLKESAHIVELHHEKPNGQGYFSIQNKSKQAVIVNIADEFVGLSTSASYRPRKTKARAIDIVMKGFENHRIFSSEERDAIKHVLNAFYSKIPSK